MKQKLGIYAYIKCMHVCMHACWDILQLEADELGDKKIKRKYKK